MFSIFVIISITAFISLLVFQLMISRCEAYSLKNESRLFFIGGSHLFHGAIHQYGFYNIVSDELAKASMNIDLKNFSPDSSRNMIDLRADLRHHILENDLLRSGDVVVLMVGSDDIRDIGTFIDERDALTETPSPSSSFSSSVLSSSSSGESGNSDALFEAHHIEELIRQRQYELTAHWHSIISLLLEFGGLEILVTTSFVYGEKSYGSNKLDEVIDEFCGAIKLFASEHHIEVIDIRQYLVSELEDLNFENLVSSILTWDGFNLNEIGHKHVAYFLLQNLGIRHTLVFDEDLALIKRRELLKKDIMLADNNKDAEVNFNELNFEELLNQNQEETNRESDEMEETNRESDEMQDRPHDSNSFRGDML